MINRLEGYTGDGFQERKSYINLKNDINRLNEMMKFIKNTNSKENKESEESEESSRDNNKIFKPIIVNHYKYFEMKKNDNKSIILNNNINRNDKDSIILNNNINKNDIK